MTYAQAAIDAGTMLFVILSLFGTGVLVGAVSTGDASKWWLLPCVLWVFTVSTVVVHAIGNSVK